MKIHTFIIRLGVTLCLTSFTAVYATTDSSITVAHAEPAAEVSTTAVDTPITPAPAAPAPTGPVLPRFIQPQNSLDLLAPANGAPPVVDAFGNVTLDLIPKAISNHPLQYNLARWYAGAAIVIFDADGQPRTLKFNADERALSPYSSLLDEDATDETPIAAGTQQVVINLNATQTIQRIALFSFSAAGSVDVYYSNASEVVKPGSPDWKSANVHSEFTSQESASLDLKAIDAHYVMLSFNITQPGTIGSLAILGNVSAIPGKAVAPKQQENTTAAPVDSDTVTAPFDYGPTVYGSHVTHVAGGPVDAAQLALDGDPTTGIPLGGEDQKNSDNILLVDLGVSRDLNKLGVLFKTHGKGQFEFYLMNVIPDMSAAPADPTTGATPPPATGASFDAKPMVSTWRGADGKLEPLLLAASTGSLAEALVMAQLSAVKNNDDDQNGAVQIANLPADFFKNNKPTFAQDVTDQQARLSIDMKKETPTRYVMLRWVPSTPNQAPIEVFEVNLIGIVPIATFVAASRINANNVSGLPPIGVQVLPGTPGFVPTTLSTTAQNQTPAATPSSSSNGATPPPPDQSNPPPPPAPPAAVSP